jgi:carboxyl-terminal processing protease
MTIARYYTPLNRSLQANGIEPDIITEEASLKFSSSFKRVREKDLAGHLAGRSNTGGTQEDIVDRSIQKAKENQKKTEKVDDYQLSKAIDLIVGLDIYGKSNNSEAL